MFKAILENVKGSPDLNKENLIDRIEGELKKIHQLIYDGWKKSKFYINHLFIQDFILSKLAKDDEELLKLFMNQGKALLCVSARHGYINVVQNLLKNGAKVDLHSKDGLTALHYAACHNFTQVIKALLKEKADINIQDKDGRTHLHYAAKCG